jgi:chromatin structure-remodeling complex subunit SFH1
LITYSEKLGKEVHEPVEVQGLFREWMIKRMLRPAYVPH